MITGKQVEAALNAFHAARGDTEALVRAALEAAESTRERSGAVPAVTDEQIDAILGRTVCDGEDVEFYLRPNCEVAGEPECTRILMREVARTILAAAPEPQQGAAASPAGDAFVLELLLAGGHVAPSLVEKARSIAAKKSAAAPSPHHGGEPLAEIYGWAVLDKNGCANRVVSRLAYEYGTVEPTVCDGVPTDLLPYLDREYRGVAPHRVVTLYTGAAPVSAPAQAQDVVPANCTCPGCGMLVFGAPAPSSAEQAGDGPDAPDGHNAEGFPGGCERFGCAPDAPCRTAPDAPADERSRFEAAMQGEFRKGWILSRHPFVRIPDDAAGTNAGTYAYVGTQMAWAAWQARAQASEPVSAPADAREGGDTKRLDFIAREYLEVSPFDMPTPGGDDADVGWRIYEFHQAEPRKRLVAEHFRDDLRTAIDRAMGAGGGK